ncbi:MAG: LPXTG cell wall anchor domain-containing protein [Lachnospiraceae bacterium]
MGRKRRVLLWLVGVVLWLTAGAAWANSGAQTVKDGQTEIMAGVVVNYMGKLRFLVLERNTLNPIEGASVELYIPSLDRYVLFGLTDTNGIYELDIAYNTDPNADLNSQFTAVNGDYSFQGSLLYLNSNKIVYQVYKAGWLLYPTQGEEVLTGEEMPQVITVYLYQKGGDGNGGGGGSSSGGSSSGTTPTQQVDPFPENAGDDSAQTGGLPKTGVEGAITYWIAGLIFFMFAGGILWYLLKKEKEVKERERRSKG